MMMLRGHRTSLGFTTRYNGHGTHQRRWVTNDRDECTRVPLSGTFFELFRYVLNDEKSSQDFLWWPIVEFYRDIPPLQYCPEAMAYIQRRYGMYNYLYQRKDSFHI
eukprot:scaffold3091_cov117-Cylindrotheca_fusiformis.AAC.3